MPAETLNPDQLAALLERVARLGYAATMQRLSNMSPTAVQRTSALKNNAWTKQLVINAYELKLLTREEARRLLGIRKPRQ